MKTQHTPGPWYVNDQPINERIHIEHDLKDGEENLSYGICELMRTSPKEIGEADAKLIAAAPDLLDVCKKALDDLETYCGNPEWATIRELKEVIKKATE